MTAYLAHRAAGRPLESVTRLRLTWRQGEDRIGCEALYFATIVKNLTRPSPGSPLGPPAGRSLAYAPTEGRVFLSRPTDRCVAREASLPQSRPAWTCAIVADPLYPKYRIPSHVRMLVTRWPQPVSSSRTQWFPVKVSWTRVHSV